MSLVEFLSLGSSAWVVVKKTLAPSPEAPSYMTGTVTPQEVDVQGRVAATLTVVCGAPGLPIRANNCFTAGPVAPATHSPGSASKNTVAPSADTALWAFAPVVPPPGSTAPRAVPHCVICAPLLSRPTSVGTSFPSPV